MKRSVIRAIMAGALFTVCTTFTGAAALAAGTVTLPATGQTLCYDQQGIVINCIGTRQDGALRMGASWPSPRFASNGDGTFTDHLTGLIWLQDNACLTYTDFLDATDIVNNLSDGQCGLTDGSTKGTWRLPNINEANSLVDLGQNMISYQSFKDSYVILHTSTTYAKDTSQFLVVNSDGSIISYPKSSALGIYLIAVKSGN